MCLCDTGEDEYQPDCRHSSAHLARSLSAHYYVAATWTVGESCVSELNHFNYKCDSACLMDIQIRQKVKIVGMNLHSFRGWRPTRKGGSS